MAWPGPVPAQPGPVRTPYLGPGTWLMPRRPPGVFSSWGARHGRWRSGAAVGCWPGRQGPPAPRAPRPAPRPGRPPRPLPERSSPVGEDRPPRAPHWGGRGSAPINKAALQGAGQAPPPSPRPPPRAPPRPPAAPRAPPARLDAPRPRALPAPGANRRGQPGRGRRGCPAPPRPPCPAARMARSRPQHPRPCAAGARATTTPRRRARGRGGGRGAGGAGGGREGRERAQQGPAASSLAPATLGCHLRGTGRPSRPPPGPCSSSSGPSHLQRTCWVLGPDPTPQWGHPHTTQSRETSDHQIISESGQCHESSRGPHDGDLGRVVVVWLMRTGHLPGDPEDPTTGQAIREGVRTSVWVLRS
ncbi:hypothetical protein VULLAG_LOCUS10251 [Vulpes lagopus]